MRLGRRPVSAAAAYRLRHGLHGRAERRGTAPGSPAKVTITDPGVEPRSVPLSGFDRANAQSAQLVTTSTSSSTATDQGPATTATTVDLPLTARVNCSDATDIDLRIGAAGSPDTALNQALKAQNGSRAGMSIGPGVVPISLRILPGEDADDTARQAVEESLFATFQRSVTLPTEPIGGSPLGSGPYGQRRRHCSADDRGDPHQARR